MVGFGSWPTKSGRTQRFRCEPRDDEDATHTFTVKIRTPPEVLASFGVAPPACPEHVGSTVVRFGTYGKTTGKPRQRYRCTPADGSKPHTFTPPLPREHVHHGEEQCDHCDELRGLHHGEASVARTHSWNARIVARSLERLAMGQSYAETSRWALRASGTEDRRGRVSADGEVAEASAADQARNSWHIAADWCEVFGPVVFAAVEQRLRAKALAERARLDRLVELGEPVDRPQVWLLDDVPVYGRTLDRRKAARRDDGFYLLVLAELQWPVLDELDAPMVRRTPLIKLRLVRAMPKSNLAAWRLCFDEVGYAPDFIVSDAGTGIRAAIDAHFDPATTCAVPSVWHLRHAIERDLFQLGRGVINDPVRGRRLIDPLATHLGKLGRGTGALDDATTWSAWWDELLAVMKANSLPTDKVRGHRRRYEPAMASALTAIAGNPSVPVATGGLETLIDSQVKRLLTPRRTAFANLERTNRLFDLVVARHHGTFDNLGQVAALLRADSEPHGGYAPPLREVADVRPRVGTYSSLRDTLRINQLARERGLL